MFHWVGSRGLCLPSKDEVAGLSSTEVRNHLPASQRARSTNNAVKAASKEKTSHEAYCHRPRSSAQPNLCARRRRKNREREASENARLGQSLEEGTQSARGDGNVHRSVRRHRTDSRVGARSQGGSRFACAS